MKINRFVALAALALLVVGAMGFVTMRSFAQTTNPPTTQDQACAAEQADDDSAEAQTAGPDTDDLEVQCGDQNESDGEAEEANEGSEQEAAPAGTPSITAEEAQVAAEAYLNAGAASQVELDDQNGQLVYSVEINGTDVTVDAMTGNILGTESAED
jgi:uncharacterized membrane protein YkoI